jgi:transcriptional regulator GlxA family with amidase domain
MNAISPAKVLPTPTDIASDALRGVRSMSVAFVLSHGFDALSVSSAIAPMRAANDAAAGRPFVWRFLAERAGAVRSSDGWSVSATALDEQTALADFTFLVGAPTASRDWIRDMAAGSASIVRRAWRLGKLVGASNAAVFVLAQSGILKGQRFVVNRDLAATFGIMWPDLRVEEGIYAADNRILTCVGGTSAADMMLGLINERCGSAIQLEALHACALPRVRVGREPQLGSPAIRSGSSNPNLLRAMQWIDAHYLDPGCLSGLAAESGVSPRQVQRLFKNFLGTTPKAYMTELRLRRAVSLLSSTELPINDIAAECGYDATTSFTKAFRERFRVVPSRYRHGRAHGLRARGGLANDRSAQDVSDGIGKFYSQ